MSLNPTSNPTMSSSYGKLNRKQRKDKKSIKGRSRRSDISGSEDEVTTDTMSRKNRKVSIDSKIMRRKDCSTPTKIKKNSNILEATKRKDIDSKSRERRKIQVSNSNVMKGSSILATEGGSLKKKIRMKSIISADKGNDLSDLSDPRKEGEEGDSSLASNSSKNSKRKKKNTSDGNS